MLKHPGYGHIKRADTPINLSVNPRDKRIVLNKNSPRRLRAKYTHRTNLRFILCVFRDCIEPSAVACRRIWREPRTDEIACNFRSRSARLMPDTAISS